MAFTLATGMLYSGARVLENDILQMETFNTCGIFDDTAKNGSPGFNLPLFSVLSPSQVQSMKTFPLLLLRIRDSVSKQKERRKTGDTAHLSNQGSVYTELIVESQKEQCGREKYVFMTGDFC